MDSFKVGDKVYHKYDILKEELVVVEVFWWLGQRKLVCVDKNGIYHKDYEHYFLGVEKEVDDDLSINWYYTI